MTWKKNEGFQILVAGRVGGWYLCVDCMSKSIKKTPSSFPIFEIKLESFLPDFTY